MRSPIAIALIAVVGVGALGLAWHLLGDLPAREAAAPLPRDAGVEDVARASEPAHGDDARASEPAHGDDARASEFARGEARREPEGVPVEAPPRAPAGFEEGGAAPLVRDYAAIYAERTLDERRAAVLRLSAEIEAARQALGQAELDELAGRRGNRPATPGVARLLGLLEERAWVQAGLGGAPQVVVEDDP